MGGSETSISPCRPIEDPDFGVNLLLVSDSYLIEHDRERRVTLYLTLSISKLKGGTQIRTSKGSFRLSPSFFTIAP